MVIHPSELFMVYTVGSLLVIKSVDGSKDRYLRGHTCRINYVTISKAGNLMASGEIQDSSQGQEECGALIVWDFTSFEILYRVRFHKQCVKSLSISHDEKYLASVGGVRDGN